MYIARSRQKEIDTQRQTDRKLDGQTYIQYEQALVCLSNREIVDASRRRTFHCKMANNRLLTVFLKWVGLIYLAIQPPSIITASVRPTPASTVSFIFSETRARYLKVLLHVCRGAVGMRREDEPLLVVQLDGLRLDADHVFSPPVTALSKRREAQIGR